MGNLNILTILFFFFFFTAANATTHTTIKSGDWDDATIWSTGAVPNISAWPGDVVIINHKVEAGSDLSFKQGASMTVNSNASLEIDGELQLQGSGVFIIASNGIIDCGKVQHSGYAGSLSVNGTLISDDVITIAGVAEFFTDGTIYASKIEIKNSGNFESKGGMIEIEGAWEISGGTVIKISNTEVVVEDKFQRTGGPSIEFTGGSLTVGDDFLGSGGGSICFDGTEVDVENDTKLSGSVMVSVGGRGYFTTNKAELKGTASIQGKDLGGWFNCNEIQFQGSAKVSCVDGNCNYNRNNADDMPNQVDLGTGNNTVLPVELLYFEAQVEADGMLIVGWATAVEINNDFFTIEMSLNGKDWKAMDTVKGAGNSDVELAYEWTAANVEARGTVYYRLKQTDFDGTFTYSSIQSVKFAEIEKAQYAVNVYPNPATEYVLIEGLETDAAPQVSLINLQGQTINISSTDEGRTTRINIPAHLPAGTYGLVIQNSGQIQTQQLVIQK